MFVSKLGVSSDTLRKNLKLKEYTVNNRITNATHASKMSFITVNNATYIDNKQRVIHKIESIVTSDLILSFFNNCIYVQAVRSVTRI